MICKIIPIKQARGIQDCWQYISDEEKVISIQKKDGKLKKTIIDPSLLGMTAEEYALGKMDYENVLAYMQNDEKTHRKENIQEKFISGYLCKPETAVKDFLDVKEENLTKQHKPPYTDTGNHAYHIIQSFPEDLDISDEEVHQCGRELCEKIRQHQAVICSHIHPVINEEGEVSGRCKHNHILINSHIHPDMMDPEKPNVYKYNNCKETYAQLQKWNDEIAINHGLPIIREAKAEKLYSWFKSNEENKGASWTKQVAKDIRNTMRFCSNWEDFKTMMAEQGYYIRETANTITYYTPEHTNNHKQQIREKRLGKEYTKEALLQYWTAIEKSQTETTSLKNTNSKAPLLEILINQYENNLFAEVLCKNKNNAYYLDVPLTNKRREITTKTLYTYFDPEETYKICTADHNPIIEVTGQDLFDYYELLKKRKAKQQEEVAPEYKLYYFDLTKLNTKTNKPYRISLWDSNGRQRTSIELICILARTIIKTEHSATSPSSHMPKFNDADGKIIYAKKDWKLQNMYDTMVMAREMKLENSADIEKKLDRAGKEVARKRKQLKSLTEQYNQMETINTNIEKLELTRNICEQIYNMPDGETKERALIEHAEDLEQYKASKRYLHLKNINTNEQITDFKNRFSSVKTRLQEVEAQSVSINEEYRNLKKIQYNISMAQNEYYCYGPDHKKFASQTKDQNNELSTDNLNIE